MTCRPALPLACAAAALLLAACGSTRAAEGEGARRPGRSQEVPPVGEKLEKSDAEWKKALTPEQYHVLREQGTERAFTGKLWNEHRKGVYACAACGAPLFSSEHKFDSGTGWPSYWQPVETGRVGERQDRSWFMTRTEVHCERCGGHLGHVFDDGPRPTGLRYCINSVSLEFRPADAEGAGPGADPAAKPDAAR